MTKTKPPSRLHTIPSADDDDCAFDFGKHLPTNSTPSFVKVPPPPTTTRVTEQEIEERVIRFLRGKGLVAGRDGRDGRDGES